MKNLINLWVYDSLGKLIDTQYFDNYQDLFEYIEIQEPLNVRFIIQF